MKESDSKENRFQIVWGIVLGGLIGFIINVLATIYYDFVFVKSLPLDSLNSEHLIYLIATLIGLVGYLAFYIYDYPNKIEFSKEYFNRFKDYFLSKFFPGRIIGLIFFIYLTLFSIAILSVIYFVFYDLLGLVLGSLLYGFIGGIFAYSGKKIRNKFRKILLITGIITLIGVILGTFLNSY